MEGNGSQATSLEAEIARIQEHAAREIETLSVQLVEINERLRYLRHVIKAFASPEPSTYRRRSRAGVKNDSHASTKSLAKVAAAIDSIDGNFAGWQLKEIAGLSDPTTYSCLKTMRAMEIIGKAGREQVIASNGKKGGWRELYRVLDRERLEALANATT